MAQSTASQRFTGPAASPRSQHVAGASVIGVLIALALTGLLVEGAIVIAFFAVGAGAGYSLSGSV